MDQFLQLLNGLLTPVIAVIATLIAVFQYRTERQRWRLDMFDKRYPVFTATMTYLSSVVKKGRADDEDLFSFLRESKDGELLFGTEVTSYLKQLYLQGVELRSHVTEMEPLPVGEDRSRHAKAIRDLSVWFGDQFDEAKRVFSPYLRIEEK